MQKFRRLIKKTYCIFLKKKQKQVLAIEDGARFGNFLYFFLHAYIARKSGTNFYVLYTENMMQWLQRFPALQNFVIYSPDFNWYDNLNWRTHYYQSFGEDFNIEQLNNFIKENILIGDRFSNNFGMNEKSVINIRRGDFYKFGKDLPSSFDQVKYVRKALTLFPELLMLKVEVVSDDVEWCERNLSSIFNEFNLSVNYKSASGPIEDFNSICSAKNLILTNSTFSYWGGYVCTLLSNENKVIAPNFGATFYQNSVAIQLHPHWKVIDVINNE